MDEKQKSPAFALTNAGLLYDKMYLLPIRYNKIIYYRLEYMLS